MPIVKPKTTLAASPVITLPPPPPTQNGRQDYINNSRPRPCQVKSNSQSLEDHLKVRFYPHSPLTS